MNQKEIDRLTILNKLIERSLTQREAVDKLKISDRQIRNLNLVSEIPIQCLN